MKELDVLKERLRQRLMNNDDGLHTELYTPGDLGVKLFEKSDHETKTSGILDNDLMKAEWTNYSNVNVPSPAMQDTQVNISQPEQNEQRRCFLEKDDASDAEDNDVRYQVTHRDNYIDSDDNSDDDDVINENNKPVERVFGANDNDDNHFLDDVSDCDNNVHPSINNNSSDNDDNCDDHKVDCNPDFNDKPVEHDQPLCNIDEKLDVVGHSRDESVDSFFDIFQRNKEVSEDVKRHCDSAYDELDPLSVVSRKNFDRLKNVFNEVSEEVVDPVINVDKLLVYPVALLLKEDILSRNLGMRYFVILSISRQQNQMKKLKKLKQLSKTKVQETKRLNIKIVIWTFHCILS